MCPRKQIRLHNVNNRSDSVLHIPICANLQVSIKMQIALVEDGKGGIDGWTKAAEFLIRNKLLLRK